MSSIKNEHIVYAYAPLISGSNLLLVGITDIGWEYLGEESGNFLKASSPTLEFKDVKEVWIVRAKDKREIREMLFTIAKQMNVKITEAS